MPKVLLPRWFGASDPARVRDLATLLGLSIIATAISAWGLSQFDDDLYRRENIDMYFDADMPRVYYSMVWLNSDLRRDLVHPLFSLLTYPVTKSAIALLRLEPLVAAKTLVALAAGASTALFYMALRYLTLPVHAAAIFAAVFITSATFVYWFAVVESFPFSALSICLMLMVLSRAEATPAVMWVVASAFTLSITITNWSLALASAFFRLPFLKFISVSIGALGFVAALALVQTTIFRNSSYFLSPTALSNEWKFAQLEQEKRGRPSWDPVDNLQSFFIYGAVSPGHRPAREPPGAINNVGMPVSDVLKTHGLPIALWLSLLTAGVWGIARNRKQWPVGAALGAFIAGQAALHIIYGEVTFLFSAHFFPALLAVAACAYFAPARRIWLAVAIALLIVGGTGNIQQFKAAVADVNAALVREQ